MITPATLATDQRIPTDLQVPALYRAEVTHARQQPLRHRFRYSTSYWLVDVDQPPRLPWPLRALARFDPADFDDPRPLLETAGVRADRILRLAHARSFGYSFNPLSVYWCYDGDRQVARIAEVHNTYGGRHSYLLPAAGSAVVDKRLYVSPFHPHEGRYNIAVSEPGSNVYVTVVYRHDDAEPFTASLVGTRVPATARRLLAASLRHPFTPLRTSALIRWQGIRLWLRGLKVQPR